MALGSNHITYTSHNAVFAPEIWSKKVLPAAEAAKVMAKLVDRYDEESKGKGDVIHIPTISNLTASAKSDQTQVTLQSPSESSVDINLNRHYESSFLVEDRISIQAAYNLLDKYTPKATESVIRQQDSDLTGLYSGLSQSVGDGSTAVTDANLIRAIQYLDDANAPQSDRHFVIKPCGKADLLAIDKFVRYDARGQAANALPVNTGAFGEIYGVQVWVTTQVITVTGTPNVVHHLLFHREAFALAEQQSARVQTQYKQEYLGTLVTVDALWGYVEQRDTFAVDFRASE